MKHINSASNNHQLTYDDIKRVSRILSYENYSELYDILSSLNGISRIFKAQQYLEDPKTSINKKCTIKRVIQDLEDI